MKTQASRQDMHHIATHYVNTCYSAIGTTQAGHTQSAHERKRIRQAAGRYIRATGGTLA